MKKILSLLLAGLMTASVFAVGASAADANTVVGADHGVTSDKFTQDTDNSKSDINVKVDTITHKYAVDLTFNFSDLTIGNIEWDVDSMKYKINGNIAEDTNQTIKIDNRSDLPVYVQVESKDTDANDFITIGFAETTANGKTATSKFEIAKATAGTATNNGVAGTDTVTLKATSSDWNSAANYYVGKFNESTTSKTFKVATITVTITKE